MAGEFKRLPGRGGALLGFSRLWLASDHLLLVESTGFSESYKRYYYRDIQSLTLRKTSTGLWWTVVWGALALASTALFEGLLPEASPTGWIMGGIFGLFLLGNLLMGPTCACHIRTAVQNEELAAWHRVRTSRKGITLLQRLAQVAQTDLPAEETAKRMADIWKELRFYNGRYHEVLGWLLLLDCPFMVYHLVSPTDHWLLHTINAIWLLAVIVFAVASVRSKASRDVSDGLHRFAWGVVLYLLVSVLVGIVLVVVLAVRTPDFFKRDVLSDPFSRWLNVYGLTVQIPLGIAGLVLVRRLRQNQTAIQSTPPDTVTPASAAT